MWSPVLHSRWPPPHLKVMKHGNVGSTRGVSVWVCVSEMKREEDNEFFPSVMSGLHLCSLPPTRPSVTHLLFFFDGRKHNSESTQDESDIRRCDNVLLRVPPRAYGNCCRTIMEPKDNLGTGPSTPLVRGTEGHYLLLRLRCDVTSS